MCSDYVFFDKIDFLYNGLLRWSPEVRFIESALYIEDDWVKFTSWSTYEWM